MSKSPHSTKKEKEEGMTMNHIGNLRSLYLQFLVISSDGEYIERENCLFRTVCCYTMPFMVPE